MIQQKPSNDYAINCNDSAFLPNDFAMICNDLQCFCNDFYPVLPTPGYLLKRQNLFSISLSDDSKENLKAMMQLFFRQICNDLSNDYENCPHSAMARPS